MRVGRKSQTRLVMNGALTDRGAEWLQQRIKRLLNHVALLEGAVREERARRKQVQEAFRLLGGPMWFNDGGGI